MQQLISYFFVTLLWIWMMFTNTGADGQDAHAKWRPVVLMHGLLSEKELWENTKRWIEQDFTGIYSQGGLLCRGFIERYNQPPVFNYIAWASPQAGVYGVPDFNALCSDQECPWLNYIMDSILDGGWVDSWVQEHITFASYWKDPLRYDEYLQDNIFLADINNEREEKNQTYKNHITSLNLMSLVYSTVDDIVIPKESPWFSFFSEGDDSTVVPLNATLQYKEDWIGLRTLNESGRLLLYAIPCPHTSFHNEECKEWYNLYTKPLLNNYLGF
jgi:palmitoyl-protein thioesterase